MHFVYQGFTHNDDRRCFKFRGVEELSPASEFCIEIDLPLLTRSRVPVQEAPMFCLHLLTKASLAGPDSLDKLHKYRVLEADFRPLFLEREQQAAARARKKPFRPAVRKPGSTSGITLGTIFSGRS